GDLRLAPAHDPEVRRPAGDDEVRKLPPDLQVADDHQAPGLRAAPGRGRQGQAQDAVERLVRDRAVRVRAARPPLPDCVGDLHQATAGAGASAGTKSISVTTSIAAATERAFGQTRAWWASARSAAARCSSGARRV